MGGWRPLLHHHASIKTELYDLPVDAGLRSWPPGRPAPRAAGRRGHAKPRSRMVSDPGASVPLTPMIRVKSTRSLATFIHRFRHGRWHGSTDITNNHKPASSSMSRSLLSLRASHALPPPNPATPWSSAHQAAGKPTRTAPCFCSRLPRGRYLPTVKASERAHLSKQASCKSAHRQSWSCPRRMPSAPSRQGRCHPPLHPQPQPPTPQAHSASACSPRRT